VIKGLEGFTEENFPQCKKFDMQLKIRHLNGEVRKGGGYVVAHFNTCFAFWKNAKLLIQFRILGDGISENVTMSFQISTSLYTCFVLQ
jgi:hypothetical protein